VTSFKWMNFIDVKRDPFDITNITLLIVWFTSQRELFNLKMAHERAETCRRDKLCNINIKQFVFVFYLYFVIMKTHLHLLPVLEMYY